MKKLIALALSLICVLGLAACGPKDQAPAQSYEVSAPAAMQKAGAFSEELEELDTETAFMLYHLGDFDLIPEDLTDGAVLRSSGATCEESDVLVLVDEAKAAKAAEALNAYVKGQIEANVDYRPEEIPKLENAVVDQQGSTVLLVVPNNMELANSVLK